MAERWGTYHKDPDYGSGYNPDDDYYKGYANDNEKQEKQQAKKIADKKHERFFEHLILKELHETLLGDTRPAIEVLQEWTDKVKTELSLDVHFKNNVLAGTEGVAGLLRDDNFTGTMAEFEKDDPKLYGSLAKSIANFIMHSPRRESYKQRGIEDKKAA